MRANDRISGEFYNLLLTFDDRTEYDEVLEPVCIENGLGVLSYFSLASGFLTGKYRSAADVANKAQGDFVKKYLNEHGFRILDTLDRVAKRLQLRRGSSRWRWAQSPLGRAISHASAFESREQLAKAIAHPSNGRVRNPTNGAPINLSNALSCVRGPSPRM